MGRFLRLYFPTRNLHRFLVDFLLLVCLCLHSRTLDFIAVGESKRYFLLNRHLRLYLKNQFKNPLFLDDFELIFEGFLRLGGYFYLSEAPWGGIGAIFWRLKRQEGVKKAS